MPKVTLRSRIGWFRMWGLMDSKTCFLSHCFLRQLCWGWGTSEIFMFLREMIVFLFLSLCIAKALPFFKAQCNFQKLPPNALRLQPCIEVVSEFTAARTDFQHCSASSMLCDLGHCLNLSGPVPASLARGRYPKAA